MPLCNLTHNGQTQTRAIHVAAQCAVEGFKNTLTFGGSNPWPIVFHLNSQCLAIRVDQQAHSDHTDPLFGAGGVVNGVVDQIANHLFQQSGIALHLQKATLAVGVHTVIAQVQTLVHGARQRVMQDLADQCLHVT